MRRRVARVAHMQSRGPRRTLSEGEVRDLIDANARKHLRISGEEFLSRRERNEPVASPAWEPINMMAFLLD